MTEPQSEVLWDQLRRRKMVQCAIAYVAAGWGLLQGLAYVGTALHWPEHGFPPQSPPVGTRDYTCG